MTARRILVGVDGRAPSLDAVRAAMALVAPDGTIVLARVVPVSALRRAADWLLHGGLTDAAQAHREIKAEWGLSKLAALLGAETSARVETVVSRGRIADELLRLRAERGCDLIVIGAARPRPFLGGAAEALLRRNPTPTLLIPEGVALDGAPRALVLAPEPLPLDALDDAGAALERLAPRHGFMPLGRGPRPGLGLALRAVPPRTVLVVQRPTAVHELGASWLLSRTSCPVLVVPARDDRATALDAAPGERVSSWA